jgi:hypothetical protein
MRNGNGQVGFEGSAKLDSIALNNTNGWLNRDAAKPENFLP